MTQEHPSLPEKQVIAPPRPEHATDRYDGPTLLYRLYDADDRLLYIGITCNPSARWEGHRGDKPWWPLVARKELTTYPDRSTALTAEREAIRTENPLHNIVGHPQNQRVHVHLVLTEERGAKLQALRMHHRRSNSDMMYDLLDAAPTPDAPASSPSTPTQNPGDARDLRNLLEAVLEAVTLPYDGPDHARRMETRADWVRATVKGALEEDPTGIGWNADFLRGRLAAEETEAAARASVDHAFPAVAAFLATERTEAGEGQ